MVGVRAVARGQAGRAMSEDEVSAALLTELQDVHDAELSEQLQNGLDWVGLIVCLFWSAIVSYSSIHTVMSAFSGLLLSDIVLHADHHFPAPSSKLIQIRLRHQRGTLHFISVQLSIDTVSTLRKVWVLIRLWEQRRVEAFTNHVNTRCIHPG